MRASQSTVVSDSIGPDSTTSEADAPHCAPPLRLAIHQRPGVRQLVKFCLVGLSSTVLDKGSAYVMMTLGETFAPWVPWWIWTSNSFTLGVTNGYFWNRKWTFQATGAAHGSAGVQYRKFLLTNFVGYLLNQGFTKLFLIPITGQVVHSQNPDKKHVLLASLLAVPIVVIWNFCAAKFWTFKPAKS
jgi:putative flippase GtrA